MPQTINPTLTLTICLVSSSFLSCSAPTQPSSLSASSQGCCKDTDCGSAQFCQPSKYPYPEPNSICRGQCTDFIREGELCELGGGLGGKCQTGLICSFYTCQKPNRTPSGVACLYNTDCQSGLVCNQRSFTCLPPAEIGGGCLNDSDCAQNLHCVFKDSTWPFRDMTCQQK